MTNEQRANHFVLVHLLPFPLPKYVDDLKKYLDEAEQRGLERAAGICDARVEKMMADMTIFGLKKGKHKQPARASEAGGLACAIRHEAAKLSPATQGSDTGGGDE